MIEHSTFHATRTPELIHGASLSPWCSKIGMKMSLLKNKDFLVFARQQKMNTIECHELGSVCHLGEAIFVSNDEFLRMLWVPGNRSVNNPNFPLFYKNHRTTWEILGEKVSSSCKSVHQEMNQHKLIDGTKPLPLHMFNNIALDWKATEISDGIFLA